MKKLFISQPMRGYTDEEILAVRDQLKRIAEATLNEEVEVLDTFYTEATDTKRPGLCFLGKSINAMAEADVMIAPYDWYRGCAIEARAASEYSIPIIRYDTNFLPIIRAHNAKEYSLDTCVPGRGNSEVS